MESVSGTTLHGSYDIGLVLLSIALSAFVSLTALNIATRIHQTCGWHRACWIAASAFAMGGGIWSMHFVAMLAFSLPAPVGYDPRITFASLGLAVAVTGIAFAIVTISAGRLRLPAAGLFMGTGIAGMHYVGMAAMRLPASLTYQPLLFAASVVIAVAASTAALWTAMHAGRLRRRLAAACLMGAAICGMHYTGMAAACFTAAPGLPFSGLDGLDRSTLALLVTVSTMAILGLELVSASVDRRFSAFRLREAEILHLSAQRLDHLIRNSSDPILVVDRIGRIRFAAPRALARLGLEAGAPGDTILNRIGGPGASDLRSALRTALRTGEDRNARPRIGGLHMTDAAGRLREYEATACDLLDEPSVGGIVLTFHDVTEDRRTADALHLAKEAAEAANRMKSQFLATMSHELRTPLNAVIGFAEIMSNEGMGPIGSEIYRDFARDIHAGGIHLMEIINQILDLSRIEAGDMALEEEELDPALVIGHALRKVRQAADAKQVRLSVPAPDGGPHLFADPQRLSQIVLNLLDNAVKFTPAGSAVTVGAGMRQDGYAVTIDDEGEGIPPDMIDRVFEPFVQGDAALDRQHDGCGLGLTIAATMARLHGGRITLDRRDGGGTRATLLLPASRIRQTDGAGLTAVPAC